MSYSASLLPTVGKVVDSMASSGSTPAHSPGEEAKDPDRPDEACAEIECVLEAEPEQGRFHMLVSSPGPEEQRSADSCDVLQCLASAGFPEDASAAICEAALRCLASPSTASSTAFPPLVLHHPPSVTVCEMRTLPSSALAVSARHMVAGPGEAFGRRLMHLVARKQALLHTNAMVSTLGGGHFLCGHLDAAKALASRQLAVARALGDPALYARVHMHFVYIALHSGRLDESLAIAQAVQQHAQAAGDEELASMAHAAAVLVTRLKAAVVPAAAPDAGLAGAGDDFARYRGALAKAGGAPAPPA